MKELHSIIETYCSLRNERQKAALATVVAVSGSAYRRPGARMLVSADGRTIGSVSGGCLERDVIEQCLQAMQDAQCKLLNYDTTHDDDIVLGSGSGCPGSVLIFIEALECVEQLNSLLMLQRRIGCGDLADTFVFGTVIRGDLPANNVLGSKFIIEKEMQKPKSKNPDLMAAINEDSQSLFLPDSSYFGKSLLKTYEFDESKLLIFLEPIVPAGKLLIFGAGHDSPALAELAHSIGMVVSVFDHRKTYANPLRFPSADRVGYFCPEDASSWPEISPNSFCAVMAHNYQVDKAVLANVLQSVNCCYVGALGPKQRTERILQELKADGIDLSDSQLSKLHAPIGLDIGAENPDQIAVSIVAEIQAVNNGRRGGFLRDRQLPIHDSAGQFEPRNEDNDYSSSVWLVGVEPCSTLYDAIFSTSIRKIVPGVPEASALAKNNNQESPNSRKDRTINQEENLGCQMSP